MLAITQVLEVHPDGSQQPVGPHGIRSTARGFVVQFRNDFDTQFAGFLEVQPPSNSGVLKLLVSASTAFAPSKQVVSVAASGEARTGQAFSVPRGRSSARFDFSPRSVDYPAGRFLINVFSGMPYLSPLVLTAQQPFIPNVALLARVVSQTVPGTSISARVVIDESNFYSEKTLVELAAVAKETMNGLRKGQVITSFRGPVMIEEDVGSPLQNAYSPAADAQAGRPTPRGRKGFFTEAGTPVADGGLLFNPNGGTPGRERFVAQSIRELTKDEYLAKELNPRVALVTFRLQGEPAPRGAVEMEQWVDVLARSRSGRSARANRMPDWAEERAWDILLKPRKRLSEGTNSDPLESERMDVFETVQRIFPLLLTTRIPQTDKIPVHSPAFTPPISPLIYLNPWLIPFRADREDLVDDQVDPRDGIAHRSVRLFSNTLNHESRHCWQIFLTRISQQNLKEEGVLDVLLVDNDPGETGSDNAPENDDDPRPKDKQLIKFGSGDLVPERSFIRVLRSGKLVWTSAQYDDAVLDRSPVVDADDALFETYGSVGGDFVAPTGQYIPNDAIDRLERDGYDYGNAMERDE